MMRTLIILLLLITACGTPGVQPEAPALLTNPGPATLREIEQTVARAMNASSVTLATDVLTRSSSFVIERGRAQGIDRPPQMGRDLGSPYSFQLVLSGSQCALVDQQTGQHWPLGTVECTKE